MKLVKCSQGHFYDEESHAKCPYCDGSIAGGDALTMPAAKLPGEDAVTVDMSSAIRGGGQTETSLQDAVRAASEAHASARDEDPKTISFFKQSMGKEPVVGWLVCIEGPHFGEDFRLKAGRNFVGRAPSMDVAIASDATVSRERHAVLVYEPRKNMFIMQPGDSKELCYLNDDVVLAATEAKVNDIILIGKTKLMLIPCCSEAFNWDMVKSTEE